MGFVKHYMLEIYTIMSLKQQSAGRFVTQLGHYILTSSQSHFALIRCGEATNKTLAVWFQLTRSVALFTKILMIKNCRKCKTKGKRKFIRGLLLKIIIGVVFTVYLSVTKDTKLQDFQYKLMHRILIANSFLYKCGLKETELSTFYTETILSGNCQLITKSSEHNYIPKRCEPYVALANGTNSS